MWSRLEQSEAEAVREREEIQALCQKILEENELNLEPIDIQLQVNLFLTPSRIQSQLKCNDIFGVFLNYATLEFIP